MPSSFMSASTRSCVGPTNCAPASSCLPPGSSWLSVRPPTRSRASSTSTDFPALATARAALSPARPPPTTMTSALRAVAFLAGFFFFGFFWRASAAAGTASVAAPTAVPSRRRRRVRRSFTAASSSAPRTLVRRMPACVVFDCDGLLLDTEHAWTRAEVALYANHGVEFTMDHKREMLGTAGRESRDWLERHLGLPGRGEELAAEMRELVLGELDEGAPPRPGALELLEALRAQGTPVGLASNSFRAFVDAALAPGDLAPRFGSVLSFEEVAHPKPAPDIYLESCARLGADPADSVALEDSPTGVAAAVAAGMYVVAVPSLEGVDLSAAHLVAPSLSDERVWGAVGLCLAA